MTISETTRNKIAEFESFRPNPYNDVAGNATVGFGHLLHRGPVDAYDKPVTYQQGLVLFGQDLHTKAEVFVDMFVRVPLSQNQYDALGSFTYNLGAGTLRTVVSETGLNNGNYAAVPAKLLEYDEARVKGVETVENGLKTRRQFEAELWSA